MCPYLAAGGVPDGLTGSQCTVVSSKNTDCHTSLKLLLPVFCPPKVIIELVAESSTAECRIRGPGPNTVKVGDATAFIPVPVKLTVSGLSLALSVNVIVPFRVPAVVGVKVTLMLQFAPAATVLPQVLVCA